MSDDISDKLAALGGGREMSVLNAGIAGNQLLADHPSKVGESALT
ncbi:MAG: SGNH/GDSL hydrolase family protein, partial [Pseudonocardiales bacterium]|nr:SGNH/GDSL hydrolase family protein [Pseudonocardiales bacterium]